MREERFASFNAPGNRQCFVQAHVGRMRISSEAVEHGGLDTLNRGDHRFRHFLAVTQYANRFTPSCTNRYPFVVIAP
jgi:hypothetical protein